MKPDEEQSGAKRLLTEFAVSFHKEFAEPPKAVRLHRHAFKLGAIQYLFCPLCNCVPTTLAAGTVPNG